MIRSLAERRLSHRPAPPARPDIGATLGLRVPGWDKATHRSRMEGVDDDGRLLVGIPFDKPALADPPRRGDTIVIGWASPTAWWDLPCRWAGTQDVPVRVWALEITGEPTRQQRRAFVRPGPLPR